MFFAIFFAFWRFAEIFTLIPTMGMLAYFVNGYVQANIITPNYILILFIVSVLGLAWALFTLFSYHRSQANARFVSLIDLAFVGAFIAGVYYLRFIGSADCTHVTRGSSVDVSFGIFGSGHLNGVDVSTDKTCAMLKASWAFGIMNCIFFFITSVLACMHGDRAPVEEKRRRSTSVSHHSHHRRSHSGGGSHHGSRHGSRRSSHSHSRAYV
ncbi:hypothetical protein B0T22DRAFT_191781 [Podospora appendiculata]|uniref:MARVEL domain-containing protein n=1 Tax=Podospora appendiculata TaxID=314037 RepID=A0AAE1CE15_9PEZI|nr:hypothetical protein B0T22DRAFT_191781 [Podospora appendiculata]